MKRKAEDNTEEDQGTTENDSYTSSSQNSKKQKTSGIDPMIPPVSRGLFRNL